MSRKMHFEITRSRPDICVCEKRFCHLLMEGVLVWNGSDGMMESSVKLEGSYCVSFNEHRQQYPAYHRRRAQTRFSQGSLRRRVTPTDCQDSIPTNFRSRARKHISSRRRKEEVGKKQIKFCQARIRCGIPRFKYPPPCTFSSSFFGKLKPEFQF